MGHLTDVNSLPSIDQRNLMAQSLQEDDVKLLLAGTNSQSSTDSANLKKKDRDDDGGGGDDDGGGGDDDGDSEPTAGPDPRYLSGCDLLMQLSDDLLNINFFQAVERQKVENRGDENFWDVTEPGDDEGEVTKIRYRRTPQLTIKDGQVRVFFPDNELEAITANGVVITFDCTIDVAATFSLSFETIIVAPEESDGGDREVGENDELPETYLNETQVIDRVYINLSGTAVTTPTSPVLVNGVEVKDDPDNDRDNYDRLMGQITPRDFAKVMPDALDVAKIGIPIDDEHLQILTAGNYILILGVKDGSLPAKEKVLPFTTGNDMIVGLSSRLADPILDNLISNSIARKGSTKINDNYDLRIKYLQVELMNDGFRLYDGAAICFGHNKGETADSAFYPNIDITIEEMLVFFDGVIPPDGEFNFRLPKPDLDIDNWDLVKFLLWGIVTHSVGWGGSSLWWYFNPILGCISTIAQILNARKDGARPSSMVVAPKVMEPGGARVQFVNLSILTGHLVMYGDAQPLCPNTATISGNRMVWLGVPPIDASGKPREKERYTFKFSDIWYEEPRYWLRWDLSGRIIKETLLAKDHQVEIGQFLESDFRLEDKRTLLSARLFREGVPGVKEHVYTKSIFLSAIPEWGNVSDYYICNRYVPEHPTAINQPRRKLHYAIAEKRCPGINRTIPFEHKFWGLPHTADDDLVTTCRDCFGYVKSVAEVRSVLEAEQSRWRKP